MRTVADTQTSAYHNKHCSRAFWEYRHRWPWTTWKSKNNDAYFKRELRQNHWK